VIFVNMYNKIYARNLLLFLYDFYTMFVFV